MDHGMHVGLSVNALLSDEVILRNGESFFPVYWKIDKRKSRERKMEPGDETDYTYREPEKPGGFFVDV